jgi:hypothetical protein
MDGQLHKSDMQSRAFELRDELYTRCERRELTEQECRGADEYLGRILNVIDEYNY